MQKGLARRERQTPSAPGDGVDPSQYSSSSSFVSLAAAERCFLRLVLLATQVLIVVSLGSRWKMRQVRRKPLTRQVQRSGLVDSLVFCLLFSSFVGRRGVVVSCGVPLPWTARLPGLYHRKGADRSVGQCRECLCRGWPVG